MAEAYERRELIKRLEAVTDEIEWRQVEQARIVARLDELSEPTTPSRRFS
jgi:hypothetical protein